MLRMSMFSEMENLQREMDQLFRGLGLAPAVEARSLSARFKLSDSGEAFRVTATLPGIDVDKLNINVTGRRLSVSGHAAAAEVPENAVWHRRERSAGSFEQSFLLPDQVDTAKVEAEYKDGILVISLPRNAETMPRKIAVKTL